MHHSLAKGDERRCRVMRSVSVTERWNGPRQWTDGTRNTDVFMQRASVEVWIYGCPRKERVHSRNTNVGFMLHFAINTWRLSNCDDECNIINVFTDVPQRSFAAGKVASR